MSTDEISALTAKALLSPSLNRLHEWAAIGPVQRADCEEFAAEVLRLASSKDSAGGSGQPLPVVAHMARRDDWFPHDQYEAFSGDEPPAWADRSYALCNHATATRLRDEFRDRAITAEAQRDALRQDALRVHALAGSMNLYFTSGNRVPIDKAAIPAAVWRTLYAAIDAALSPVGVEKPASLTKPRVGYESDVARGRNQISDAQWPNPCPVCYAAPPCQHSHPASVDLAAASNSSGSTAETLAVSHSAMSKLAAFGAACLHHHRGTQACEVGDIDGGTAQESAIECGVLEARMVTESCGESCVCADVGFPLECYFVPDDVRAARNALAGVPARRFSSHHDARSHAGGALPAV